MLKFVALIIFVAVTSHAAIAQVTDPSMSCADYLKAEKISGPTPKTGDATMDAAMAAIDKKMTDYCTAHPTDKAMDASMKAMGG